MTQYLRVTLESRGVTVRAQMLTEAAPRTCAAVWDALPAGGPVYQV